jgi:hypothetical protein
VFFDQMATKIGGAAIRPLFGFVEVLAAFAIKMPPYQMYHLK